MSRKSRLLVLLVALLPGVLVRVEGSVFINELHYDNASTDEGEGVEVAGLAGTDLAGYRLEFYNGNGGRRYGVEVLAGLLVAGEGDGAGGGGVAFFGFGGIQNGAPDGVALVAPSGEVVEFLSYEGTLVAVDGAAAGLRSTDIGVSEGSATPVGHSLQRTGAGAVGSDFSWTGPSPGSPGRLNAGQVIEGDADPAVELVFPTGVVVEGGAPVVAELRIEPPPPGPVRVVIKAGPAGEVDFPAVLTVGEGGRVEFEVWGVDDAVPDGDRAVLVTAGDVGGGYLPGSAWLTVADAGGAAARARRGTVRVASANVENGVGAPGTPAFEAMLAVLARVDADVVAFQEADSGGGFADLRALVEMLGIGAGGGGFAVAGDAFSGQGFAGGDFGDIHSLAVASRFPIVGVVQIGRGEAAREHARFPLFVRVDVPGAPRASGLGLVVVHHKAAGDDASVFRRAVESFRVAEFVRSSPAGGGPVVVLGDFNDDAASFQPLEVDTGINPATHLFPDGSMLPVGYTLGADLSGAGAMRLGYRPFPAGAYGRAGLDDVGALQVDGNRVTRNVEFSRRLDYLFAPAGATGGAPVAAEVYNSALEAVSPGLPKVGVALPAGASRTASDHLVTFADLALEPLPALRVAVDAVAVPEGAGAVTGTVELDGAAAFEVEAEVVVRDPDEAIGPRLAVVVPAGGTGGSFAIDVVDDGRADPDARVVVSASAPGFATGYDTFVVRNRQASGRVLISQYHDPAAGSSGKAVELWNAGTGVIDFAAEPLLLRRFVNGGLGGSDDLRVTSGLLGPGEVVVAGDSAVGAHLASAGMLGIGAAEVAALPNGAVVERPGGSVAYVKQPMLFNGDDALVVVLGGVTADTFGTVGDDPGEAWRGGGVETRDANLGRAPWSTAGSAGWTDPSLRFVVAAPGGDLSGFGEPPALEPPFVAWAEEAGLAPWLAGPDCDADGDGFGNLWEFASGTDPRDPGSFAAPEVVAPASAGVAGGGSGRATVLYRRRTGVPSAVEWAVEASADGRRWVTAGAEPAGGPVPDGDDAEWSAWEVAVPESLESHPGELWLRVRATSL